MELLGPRKTYLFTPGPTPVPDAVLRAMSAPVIHHRTAAFQERLATVLDGMRRIIGTTSDVAMFGSSGTGAMESAVANLVSPGDDVVVAAFGRFGERWAEIARRYGANVHLHVTEWGQRPDPDEVGSFVASVPGARVVFTTHSETSTGAVADAEALARAIRAHAGDGPLLVIDAVSSLGAAEMRADEWGYDVVVTGSQKALMVPPGLGFASVSPRAEQAAASCTSPRNYLDWAKALTAHRNTPPSTPFTPAITIILGLEVALGMIFDEGLDDVYARHEAFGRATRAAVAALGLDLFSPDHDSSCVLTAATSPDGLDSGKITRQLREYGVTIAGGQAHLKGQVFRLGHCGWVNAFDVITCIAALERGLVELGLDIPVGAGVAAAQQSLSGVPVS